MSQRIKTSHGVAILTACLLVFIVLINVADQGLGQFSSFTALINARSQLAQVSGAGSQLVGWWTFDSGSASDSSGNNNNGTISTYPTYDSPITFISGKFGLAAKGGANTDSMIQIPDSPSLDVGTGDFTVSLWHKVTSGATAYTVEKLFVKTNTNGDNGIDLFNFKNSGTAADVAGASRIRSSVNINDDLWHHIVLVRQSGVVSLYIDTRQDGTGSAPGTVDVPNSFIDIGAGNNQNDYPLDANGYLDDVRFYSRALSTNEIMSLYNLGGGDQTPPTVSITAPASGATVLGTAVTLSANANDNLQVAGVQFKVDGTNIGSEDASPSSGSTYTINWDTTSPLVSNGSHTVTAVARDTSNNTSQSSVVVMVNNDLVPPSISGGTPTGTIAANTQYTTLQVTTNKASTCKYSTTGGESYANMTSTFTSTGGTSHSNLLQNLQNGTSYNYYVRCAGTSLNPTTSDYTVSFSVAADTIPPVISNIAVSPLQTSATVSWSTDKTSTSQVSYGASASYGQTTTLDSTLVTYHSVTLTGLNASTGYHYQVLSTDSSNNHAASSDATFTTASAPVSSGNIYVAQTAQGTDSGADCADAHSIDWLNAYNPNSLAMLHYGVAGGVNPGGTIHLCGTIKESIPLNYSGTPGNPITLYFEPGAKLSTTTWGTSAYINGSLLHPAIYAPTTYGSISYWIIDGGTNGIIEATDNGTGRACKGAVPPSTFYNLTPSQGTGSGVLSAMTGNGILLTDPYDSSKLILADKYYHNYTNLRTDLNSALANYGNAASSVLDIFDSNRMYGMDDSANYTSGPKAGIGNTYCMDSNGVVLSGNNIEIKNLTMQNIFVHQTGDKDDQAGTNGMQISGNNIQVHNNLINMVGNGIIVTYGYANTQSVYVYSNTITNVNWGMFVNASTQNTNIDTYDYKIHDNYIDHLQSWSVPGSSSYHSDGIILNANAPDTNIMHGLKVYNNTIGPDVSTVLSDQIKLTPNSPYNYDRAAFFNNVLLGGPGTNPTNGYLLTVTNNSLVANNTFVADPNALTANAINGIGNNSSALNNLMYHMVLGVISYSNNVGLVDYNAYDTTITVWWYIDPSGTLHPLSTFAEWKNIFPSYDLHSNFIHPTLDSNYRPTSSDTAAIGKGENLTTLYCGQIPELCYDKNGTHRPSTGPWDIGAYQYSSAPIADTQAPTVPMSLVTTSVISSSVGLSWNASTDNSAVAGYKIYRCQGSSCTPLIQLSTSATNSYTDSSVSASTAYKYAVSAYDSLNNESAKSSPISVTTPASNSPTNGSCSTTVNSCTTGTFSDVLDTSSNYLWSCTGSNGGTTTQCSLPIATTPAPTPSGGGGGGGGGAPTLPNISGITTKTSNNSSIITWTTSVSASSQILYGLTSIYGSQTAASSTLVTSHTMTLSALQPNTTYHFKIVSKDSSNTAILATDLTFTTLQSTATGVNTISLTPVATPSTPTIPTTLLAIPFGSRNASVITLQNYLIQYGYLASGLNTGYYGTLTQTAVAKYRASIATVSPTTQSSSSQLQTPSSQFTRSLKLGSTGSDVKALQVFLNNHGYIIASTGNGSKGHESTYYGPATAAAVSRFQLAHFSTILAPYGLSRGTGNFGPSTMRVVNGMK